MHDARQRPGIDHCGQSTLQRRRSARLTARNAASRAFSLTFCFADRDAVHRHNPHPDPGARVRLAQRIAGPATGKLAAQGPAAV